MDYYKNSIEAKVPLKIKTAYASGGLASVIVNLLFAQYLTYFYTDVFGIGAASVGTLFMVSRIWDAVNDPLCGLLVDRTNTRWGKSRPWFLWTALPYGLFAVLCFTAPDLSPAGKLIFAFITYNGLGMAKTALNIPLLSIMSGITTDPRQRTVLNSWRMISGQFAGAFVSFATIYLVSWLGHGHESKGYFLTVLGYGIFCSAAILFCFSHIRETVIPVSQKSLTLKQSFQAIRGNLPLYICIFIFFLNIVIMTLKNSAAMYYMKYNLNRPELMAPVSLTSYIGVIAMFLTPLLLKKTVKRNLYLLGYFIQIAGLLIVWIGNSSIPLLFTGNIINGLGAGFTTGLLNSMMADTIDYGEWKTGLRAEGFASSLYNFGEKIGSSLGGILVGFVLAAGRYVPNAVSQSGSALTSISFLYIILPLLFTVLGFLVMCFYRLDGLYEQIQSALHDEF